MKATPEKEPADKADTATTGTYVEGADCLSFAQFGSPTAVLLTVRYDFDGVGK